MAEKSEGWRSVGTREKTVIKELHQRQTKKTRRNVFYYSTLSELEPLKQLCVHGFLHILQFTHHPTFAHYSTLQHVSNSTSTLLSWREKRRVFTAALMPHHACANKMGAERGQRAWLLAYSCKTQGIRNTDAALQGTVSQSALTVLAFESAVPGPHDD